MTPIAQAALDRARQPVPACLVVATKPATRTTKQPIYATPAPVYASTPSVYASPAPPVAPAGRVEQYQVMRGREAAVEFIQQCPAQLLATWGIADLVQRMEASLANKPASYAYGFNQVLDLLRVEQLKVAAKPQTL